MFYIIRIPRIYSPKLKFFRIRVLLLDFSHITEITLNWHKRLLTNELVVLLVWLHHLIRLLHLHILHSHIWGSKLTSHHILLLGSNKSLVIHRLKLIRHHIVALAHAHKLIIHLHSRILLLLIKLELRLSWLNCVLW